MKKTIYECDRCGAVITDVAYTLTCYAEDVTPGAPGTSSTAAAVQNTKQNMVLMSSMEKCLCGKCKDELTNGLFIV